MNWSRFINLVWTLKNSFVRRVELVYKIFFLLDVSNNLIIILLKIFKAVFNLAKVIRIYLFRNVCLCTRLMIKIIGKGIRHRILNWLHFRGLDWIRGLPVDEFFFKLLHARNIIVIIDQSWASFFFESLIILFLDWILLFRKFIINQSRSFFILLVWDLWQ